MTKIWTLLLILAISTLFIHVPDEGQIGFILSPEIKLSYNQYAWMLCEHLIMIALSAIILDESAEHRNLVMLFLWIQIVDLFAFVLAYTDPLKEYVITFNILKLLIFLSAIVIDRWKLWKQGLSALN